MLSFRSSLRISSLKAWSPLTLTSRKFSRPSGQALELRYEKVSAPSSAMPDRGPLVICHGLFGSKQNWRSISKIFAARLNTDIFSLDLRNHGTSPHSETMDYSSMAADVLHFCRTHGLQNICLLGHSMGGKVAMALALQPDLPTGILSKLVVADVAPSNGALSPEFRSYVDAMERVERSQVQTRKEANDILREVEEDTSIRAFLLTNITSSPGGGPLKFRVPVDIIKRSLGDIGGFPYQPGECEWKGSTLIIKGERSKYINKHNIPIAYQFFPTMRLETLEAGHWVHAEKPQEFVDLVVKFIKET